MERRTSGYVQEETQRVREEFLHDVFIRKNQEETKYLSFLFTIKI